MKFSVLVFTACCFVLSTVVFAQSQNTFDDFNNMPLEELEREIHGQHPSAYFVLAARMFMQGNKPVDAVKWLYVGQIRYRALLEAKPDHNSPDDQTLFSALLQTVGTPLNEYIGADVDEWLATIDAAIDWHEQNTDDFLGKEKHADVYARVVDGLQNMKAQIASEKDQIRASRAAEGLENRR